MNRRTSRTPLSVPVLAAVALLVSAPPSQATGLVYTPVNPSFGGNPLNGNVLLNNANAQNRHKDPDATGPSSGTRTPSSLDTFNQRLQSLILSRIADSVTGDLFDENGNLKAGLVETNAFSILIEDLGNGALKITTTDKATGASSSFQVNSNP